MFVAKGRNLQWLGNGPLWVLYFLVVTPRGGPEPAVAHAKSTFGPKSPVLPGDNAKRPADSDFATKYKKQRLLVSDLLKLPCGHWKTGSWCNVDALMNSKLLCT